MLKYNIISKIEKLTLVMIDSFLLERCRQTKIIWASNNSGQSQTTGGGKAAPKKPKTKLVPLENFYIFIFPI